LVSMTVGTAMPTAVLMTKSTSSGDAEVVIAEFQINFPP
jgi:hypothetical protein